MEFFIITVIIIFMKGGIIMDWKEMILRVLVLTALSLGLFELIKRYVLTKFKINKKYLFIFMVVVMFLPLLFPQAYSESFILQQGMMLLFILSMLSYFEVSRKEKFIKNRPIVGKPKAKPNRVKDDKK